MVIRRAFYYWLLPAALVLPLWLLIGWGVFNAQAWSFVWVLFIAVPSVLIGQLVLAFLVRSRPTVRAERAVSWRDVVGFGIWHALTISVGFFAEATFMPLLLLSIVAAIALFWSSLGQLWSDARSTLARYSEAAAADPSAPLPDEGSPRGSRVIVIAESADGGNRP